MDIPYPQYNWIDRLSEPVRKALRGCMIVKRYVDGESIYQRGARGDQLYQIVSGNVRLYILNQEGKELLYTIYQPGICFGEMSLIDDLPRAHVAQAFGQTELAVLTRIQFERLWMLYPEIPRELCRLFCKRERSMFGVFENLSLLPLSERIAIRLCEFANTLGHEKSDGIHFVLRITQEDISFMVAASRQSVNKIFSSWQKEGIVEVDYGAVIIKDLPALKKLITDTGG